MKDNSHRAPEDSIQLTEVPATEVPSRPVRRRFSAKYKLSILQQADGCTGAGEIGALLRREGLYSSLLSSWRRQRDAGQESLLSQRRGPKPKKDAQQREIERLTKANQRLEARLEQTELIIDVQKKLSRVLGIDLTTANDESW